MGHVPHLVHWLVEETKYGGFLAVIGGVIGWFLVNQPLMVDAEICKFSSGPCTQQVFEPEHLAANLGGAALFALLGVGVARLLMSTGTSKDSLGVSED
jgi:hypothetical protein